MFTVNMKYSKKGIKRNFTNNVPAFDVKLYPVFDNKFIVHVTGKLGKNDKNELETWVYFGDGTSCKNIISTTKDVRQVYSGISEATANMKTYPWIVADKENDVYLCWICSAKNFSEELNRRYDKVVATIDQSGNIQLKEIVSEMAPKYSPIPSNKTHRGIVTGFIGSNLENLTSLFDVPLPKQNQLYVFRPDSVKSFRMSDNARILNCCNSNDKSTVCVITFENNNLHYNVFDI